MAMNSITNEDEELTISIQDILNILRANLAGIIALMLIGGVLFGAYSKLIVRPKYAAQAKMYVLSGAESSLLNLSELEMSTRLASDYVEMILSRPMLEEVIDELSISDIFTAASLERCISIENPEDTRILNLTVVCTDAVLAADIANTLADVSARNISEIMETSAPKVFQRAIVMKKKVAPNNSRNILIGMILGAAIAIVTALLFYITDDTIKSEADIERYSGLPTFGVISDDPAKSGGKKAFGKKSSAYGGYGSYR